VRRHAHARECASHTRLVALQATDAHPATSRDNLHRIADIQMPTNQRSSHNGPKARYRKDAIDRETRKAEVRAWRGSLEFAIERS